MELWWKFPGAPISKSDPEDHPLLLHNLLEAEDQLGVELGGKLQGTEFANSPKSDGEGDQVAE